MNKILRIDFETYSEVPLGGKESVGIWNYANHSSTQILMMAYKLSGAKTVELWQAHLGPMPSDLKTLLLDPEITVSAFNSCFERYILQFKLGITIPASRFLDPQISARYLSMPASLEEVGEILRLPPELAKDKRGEQLIKLFCEPQRAKKVRGQEQEYYQATAETHPVEWQEFCQYCIKDVVAEEEVSRRMELLQALPLPEFERRLWIFDQKVNDRGIPVDIGFVKSAYKLAVLSKKEALDKQNKITGLENANSRNQLLPWLKERGYTYSTLRKETVDTVLKDPETKLAPEAREVLKARREASSTSYQKLSAILQRVSFDGRLRNQFVFMGSSRCGRWSGSSVQLQNLARPSAEFEDQKNLNLARDLIYGEKYDEIKARFGSVLLTIKNCIRTVFVAPEDERFNICDLSGIEARVGAWVAQCPSLMKVFELNHDPYLDMAVKMTGLTYDRLAADLKSKDPEVKAVAKRHRQLAKPATLGCGYGLSGGGWGLSKPYVDPETGEKVRDKVKTGLWNYAEGMGVEMTLEQAHMAVRIFRESYSEIPKFWYELEKAIADVLDPKTTSVIRKLGPGGCIVFDKINIEGRHPLLRMTLPSGRRLHYLDARIESSKMPWEDEDGGEVWRPTLVYSGQDQNTKQWGPIKTRGAKTFENAVQGISRDVLGVAMLLMEEQDLSVVLHAHDEAACITPKDAFAPGYQEMEEIMNRDIFWAPGLLLGSEGFESPFYKKA